MAALFALALTTGMRPSEYLALKWSDIDWQRGAASVSRTIQVSRAGWAFDDTKRNRSRRVVKLQTCHDFLQCWVIVVCPC
jgi:integrase